MNILQLIPLALRIEISGQLAGGLMDSKFHFEPLRCIMEGNEAISVFQFQSNVTSSENNFTLDAVVRIPFKIDGRTHIEYDDCVEMIKMGLSYIQNVANRAIFPSDELITIPLPEPDVLKSELNTFLEETNRDGCFGL
jgi:hypothetical protein